MNRTVQTGRGRLVEISKRIQAEFAEEFKNTMLMPGETLLSNYRHSDQIHKRLRERPRFAFGIICVLSSILFTIILFATIFFSSSPMDFSNPEDVLNVYFVAALCVVLMVTGLCLMLIKTGHGKVTLVYITDKRLCIDEIRKAKKSSQEIPVDAIESFIVINKNRKGGKPPIIKVIITKTDRKKVVLRPRRIDLNDTVAALQLIVH